MVEKTKKKKKGFVLICQRCNHRWIYTGKAEYYTSCPYCKTTVNVVTRLECFLNKKLPSSVNP